MELLNWFMNLTKKPAHKFLECSAITIVISIDFLQKIQNEKYPISTSSTLHIFIVWNDGKK